MVVRATLDLAPRLPASGFPARYLLMRGLLMRGILMRGLLLRGRLIPGLLLRGLLIPGLLIPGLVRPAVAEASAPEELVGLFIQGCLPFAGNASALRDWARRTGLPPVPEQARAAFLHGAPGQAFDGSASQAKLVLVSSDDGLCSAVTDQATRQSVADALEDGFRKAGLTFRLVIERDDARVSAIHDREYLAAKDKRAWRILAATVKDDKGGEAMLTAAPE